jgi:DNA polymerase-3 subunit beta
MKTTVMQESFSKALGVVGRIVPSRGQLPILANVLLEAEKEGLWLTVTNLEIGLRIMVGGKVLSEGAITVPAKNLAEYISSLSGNVSLESEAEKLIVISGKSKATFSGIAASEFPVIPKFSASGSKKSITSIKRKVVSQIASQVAFAAAGEESRPVLTGIQFKQNESKLWITATDGFRLSRKSLETEDSGVFGRGLIMPARTITELARIISDGRKEEVAMEMVTENNQVIFEYDNTQLISRILEGNFPDVDKIIPSEFNTEVLVDREELVRGVKAVSIFARDNNNIVKFKVSENKLLIEASASSSGESADEIEVDKKGDDVAIAFNYRYLLDYINSVEEDRIKIKLNGSLLPGVFVEEVGGKEGDRIYLVMPVRV